MGTFAISVYSGLGAESLHPLSPLTTTLNFGVIDPEGLVPVRVVYDYRVMDGATVARALARLEEILNSEIADELAKLASPGMELPGEATPAHFGACSKNSPAGDVLGRLGG